MKLSSINLKTISGLANVSLPAGVLSIYLPIDPATFPHEGHVVALMDALKELRASSPANDRARIDEEAERVLHFVREESYPHGSALVMFSCLPADLWRAVWLQLPVSSVASFAPEPFLQPLQALIDDYPPALVVLVNQNEARLLSLQLGELREKSHVESDVPGLQRQGGVVASRYESDRLQHIRAHMKRVAEAIEEAERDQSHEHILLAGTEDATSGLAEALPKSIKDKLAGSIRIEMFASDAEVVAHAGPALEAAERAHEKAVTARLIDAANSRANASLGLDETTQRLREGRAQELVLSHDVLDTTEGKLALSLARDGGAEVEVVSGEAAEMLAPHAGYGAFLRY